MPGICDSIVGKRKRGESSDLGAPGRELLVSGCSSREKLISLDNGCKTGISILLYIALVRVRSMVATGRTVLSRTLKDAYPVSLVDGVSTCTHKVPNMETHTIGLSCTCQ
jgi:hypothetical protein